MIPKTPMSSEDLPTWHDDALDHLLAAAMHADAPADATARVTAGLNARIASRARPWRAAAAAGVLLLAGSAWLLWPKATEPAELNALAPDDYAVLLPAGEGDALRQTLNEIEWVQVSWLPRG